MQRLGRREGLCAIAALLVLTAACTRIKRLSGEEDNVVEGMLHGVLGVNRDASEYFRIVRQSHDRRFGYRISQEEFQIDRVVDAVQRLGDVEYERLEGQAQVVSLLCDVLLEDPSALARSSAATSLTRLDLRLPRGPAQRVTEPGRDLLSLLQELDGLHVSGSVASVAASRRSVRIVEAIGALRLSSVGLAQDAIKPFFTRPYLVRTGDGPLRRACDRAMVQRMRDLTRLALRAAIDSQTDFVREEALRGLKTLGDRRAEPAVLARLRIETDPRVRSEAVEYLGMSASGAAVAALLPMLEDGDPSLRVKARDSLTRIAGRDLGIRRSTWTRWARQRYPELSAGIESGPPQVPVR